MKKLLFLLVIITACQRDIVPVKSRAVSLSLTDVNIGTTANDGTGDPLRTAFQKVNANNALIEAAIAATSTTTEVRGIVNDSIDGLRTNALSLSSLAFTRADSNDYGEAVTRNWVETYVAANGGSGGSGGSGKYMLQFIVGSTSGAPANGDTTMTVSALANMHIDLFRGTTADLHRQDLNRTATNGKTGYRFNSSGTIVVRPAWATGDRAIIEAVPVAGVSWITLGSTGASAYMTETFEGAGYANPIWAETVGSGSVVDEDAIGITPPEGGGSQTLQITKVSPNYNAASVATLAADQVVSYTTFYVYINEHGLVSTDYISLMSLWQDGYSDDIAAVNLYVDSYDSDRLKFVCAVNEDGTGTRAVAWPGSGSSVALDTWYKFNIKYDITNDAYEVKVTPAGGSEVTVMTGSLTDTHPTTGLRLIKLGNTSDSKTWDIYFDNVAVGTTAYPTF
jgi:hypothetical protein